MNCMSKSVPLLEVVYFLHAQVSTGVYEKLICEVLSGKVVTDSSVVSRIVWSSWTR